MNAFKSILILIFSTCPFWILAQQLHTPDQIEQYMKKSAIQYNMDSLLTKADSIFLPKVEKGYSLSTSKKVNQTQNKDPLFSKKSQRYLKKARKANENNKLSKALKFYKKTANKNPNNSLLMNELASFFWENNDFDNVVFWAKKGVELNPIDFEAHARLALGYQLLGKNQLALEHIILAHLYNRNHPKVIGHLKAIFAVNGMVYQDFVFQPEYKIESKDSTKVSIQANENPWKAYAACKALWEYDETYTTQMSHFANIETSKIEDKECMLNALIGYERMKTGKENFPSLNIMGNALRYRMIDDYILYEVSLRKDPKMIYSMSAEKRQKIIRYLTTVRVNRKVNAQ